MTDRERQEARMRNLLACLVMLGLLALASGQVLAAAPFSWSDVLQTLGATPRSIQVLTCTTASATSSQLPAKAMLRLSPDSASVYYKIGSDATVSASLTDGVFLPQAGIEYVQNGDQRFIACITRSGTAYFSISIME